MNEKQKLTALFLALSLSAGTVPAFARPTSQFGFKGWPYRQNSCVVVQSTCTPAPTTAPTAPPAWEPPIEATAVPTVAPSREPAPVPTAVPTVKPTAKPAPTAAPTATKAPQATPKPQKTPAPPSTDGDYTTPSISVQEENAFLLLNQDRIANGLPALALDPELSRIARMKSKDMFENKYFAHNSPTYGSASQMLKHFGYSFNSVGENIAHHATVEKSQAAFMSSSGHRRNILGSQWSKVGIGVWRDAQGFVYVTQLFVR